MSKKPPVKGKGAPSGEPKAIDPLEYVRKVLFYLQTLRFVNSLFLECLEIRNCRNRKGTSTITIVPSAHS